MISDDFGMGATHQTCVVPKNAIDLLEGVAGYPAPCAQAMFMA